MKIPVAALVGPTAVGKTDAALEVAEALGAEIVSVDSMQVYRGMDIGTAKPSKEQRSRVRHHLIDIIEPDRDLTVAEFQSRARDAIDDVTNRGVLPLLVGGSGLYFRAVVDDLEFPPRDPATRQALEEEAEDLGAAPLHARLRELDPKAAARIAPGNARRTIRALEVIAVTGRPFSDNDSWDRYESRYDLAVAGLQRPRQELHARIAARVDAMVGEGLIEEARKLAGGGLGPTARQALGYRQIVDAGDGADPDEIRDAIVQATTRFARRQKSWFRADPRVVWFEANASDVTDRLIAFFEARRASETGAAGRGSRSPGPS